MLVCEDERVVARDFTLQLEAEGFHVVGAFHTGAEAVAAALETRPDALLMDIVLPDMDGIEAVRAICREHPVAVVLVTGRGGPESIEQAKQAGIHGYLLKPVAKGALKAAIELALVRFKEVQAMRDEIGELKETLASRKLVERAKGLVMERAKVSEEKAYLMLQKAARNQNLKLAEVARRVIEARDGWKSLFGPASPGGR